MKLIYIRTLLNRQRLNAYKFKCDPFEASNKQNKYLITLGYAPPTCPFRSDFHAPASNTYNHVSPLRYQYIIAFAAILPQIALNNSSSTLTSRRLPNPLTIFTLSIETDHPARSLGFFISIE